MKIYAIRHTKPDIESGICYGQSDLNVAKSFPLEQKGVADKLDGIWFDWVFCSPLLRCKILAESMFEDEVIVFDERLKELNFGDWELKAWDDIYSDPNGKVWMDNFQTLPTLNGESYPEMQKRVKAFLDEIKEKDYKNIAVFAHAGVIRILKSLIENVPISELFECFKPAYGSVTEFNI